MQWYLTGEYPQQTQDELTEAETTKVIPKAKHQDHVTVVWFEAWRYQHEQVPVVALLQEIRSQLAWYVTLGQQAKKMLEVTIRSALLLLEDLTKKIGIQASKILLALLVLGYESPLSPTRINKVNLFILICRAN